MFRHLKYYTLLYTTPSNLSYFWNFGSLALFFLIIQIITGLFLSCYYINQIDFAFSSVEFIMREVNNGWLLRYLHSNGASFFFFVVYLHIARGFFYGSFQFPRLFVWLSGLFIYFLMILTAFLGYVLPWGQMSFRAATVITSLITVVPVIGTDLVMLVWGGFGIGQPTLSRFYTFHFILPFIIFVLVLLHLLFLHLTGSSHPLSNNNKTRLEDSITFHPYYTYKDIVGILLFTIFYFIFVFFYPNLLGHPLNYIPANPGVTPPHIVPEWYFLPFYGILRAIPSKFFGVVAMLGSLLSLAILPFVTNRSYITNFSFLSLYQMFIFWYFAVFVLLGWVGAQVLEYPFVFLSQIGTCMYFSILFVAVFISTQSAWIISSYESLKERWRRFVLRSYRNYLRFRRKLRGTFTKDGWRRYVLLTYLHQMRFQRKLKKFFTNQ